VIVQVRLPRPSDREAVVALLVGAYPERAGELARWDDQVWRWVAAEGARVVGCGSFWPVRLHRFRMDLAVVSERRRRGIGGRLLGVLASAAEAAGAATLQARTESDRPEVLAFLNRRGFAETMRMHRLVLDVANATLEPYADLEGRLATAGITLTTLGDEQRRIGDASWHHLSLAHHSAQEGWLDPDPDPDAGRDPPLAVAEFRRKYEEYAQLLPEPEPCILAVRGDVVVGFTGAIGTGVRPALRGRGIATALKARAIIAARDSGLPTLFSTTGNPAMLKVNERLGFRVTTTEVRLVRRLQQPVTRD
jgi:GNAT superfamily N-acetyltransferase